MIEFREFPKIPRFSRTCVITEKIDGTNASIYIPDRPDDLWPHGVKEPLPDGYVEGQKFLVGSRTRWITPATDNHGFARWAYEHEEELLQLGPGHHFGEWWGAGIQRGYGLPKGEKRFSLFNVGRWKDAHGTNELWQEALPAREEAPKCCYVVPILGVGMFGGDMIYETLAFLGRSGSAAAPFMNPEGIIIYHIAGGYYFKKTLEKDEVPKGAQ